MPLADLKKTPLHECHIKLGARMVPFAGYEMPVQYSGVLEETRSVRKTCGLFDVSHMGQFRLSGKNALEELSGLVTNDLSKLALGQAQYNMLCNEAGGVLDDLVVYRRSEEEVYLCVNASNRKTGFDWLQSHLTRSVELVDESDATALLALQGPLAESLLCELGNATQIRSLKYYWAQEIPMLGRACYLSRTGYTGEDGFELYVSSEVAPLFWETLLEKGRSLPLVPCGLGARDTLRLEMGYPLHGHELSPTITPLSAGLSWTVRLKKSIPFLGASALCEQVAKGVDPVLRAFSLDDRRIARQGYAITTSDKEKVGQITSGTFSPHRDQPIALGFVKKAFADGALFVEVRDTLLPLKTVKLPFVPSNTKKN